MPRITVTKAQKDCIMTMANAMRAHLIETRGLSKDEAKAIVPAASVIAYLLEFNDQIHAERQAKQAQHLAQTIAAGGAAGAQALQDLNTGKPH